MKKQNYVRSFMLFSTFMTICALVIFYFIAINKGEFDVDTISKESLQKKADERIEFQKNFSAIIKSLQKHFNIQLHNIY